MPGIRSESAPVQVERHRLTLKVAVQGRTATLTRKVAPGHPGKIVVIQRARGTRFATFARQRLSRKSRIKLVKKLKRGTYRFRVSLAADRCYFAGVSGVRSVRVR